MARQETGLMRLAINPACAIQRTHSGNISGAENARANVNSSGEHLLLRTANTEDGARLDIKARGFWKNRWKCAFFDIRVFYPNAQSNQLSQLHDLCLASVNHQLSA